MNEVIEVHVKFGEKDISGRSPPLLWESQPQKYGV